MPRLPAIPIRLQDHDVDGHFSQLVGAPRMAWPVRVGVPFPQGVLRDAEILALRDAGRDLPCAPTVTARWPDGSLKWVSLLALVDLEVSETRTLLLEFGGKKAAASCLMEASSDTKGWRISNGSLAIEGDGTLEAFRVTWKGATLATHPPTFSIELDDGRKGTPAWKSVRVEKPDALRARAVFSGRYLLTDGSPSLHVELGFELTAGQDWVEGFHRVTHAVPSQSRIGVRHLGMIQRWELGKAEYVVRQVHRGEEWLPRDVQAPGRVEVLVTAQRARVSDHAMVKETVEKYPSYLRSGLDNVEPWLTATDGRRLVMFWTDEATGHSPQGWALEKGAFAIDWFPSWAEAPALFPQGRAKTHLWRWHFSPALPRPVAGPDARRAFDSPFASLATLHSQDPLVSIGPSWARRCGVMHLSRALEWAPSQHPRFEGIFNHHFDLKWPQGCMDWGDDVDPGYTRSYVETGLKKAAPVWTNNEYDFLYAAAHQMLRTGQPRFWRVVRRCARHALDVDFVHFSEDPWLHHGSPAHSADHTTAASYPSHIWTEGLLHWWYLSADERAFDIARKSGDFLLRYLDKRWWVMEATARESGWTLLALAELYAATGEARYRDGARRIRDFLFRGAMGRSPLFPGEASFFIGVLVMGLDRLNDVDPDRRTAPVVDRIMQWRLDHRMSPEGIPVYHWDPAKRMVTVREIMFPAGLAIAHRLTGRRTYLEALWRCLQYWLDTETFYGCGFALCTKTAASFYRTWLEAFSELAEAGVLDQLEYPPLPGKVRKRRV
ncbi:MAG: hypothetical protein IT578_07490 [Verrucomicrobiae bacterium]|nr:hypothetical protein [Verrucomicrobiae bacterium]